VVPNDAVGLIIGKSGETIRKLQNQSGAKIQVAKTEIKDTNVRNVFVEGSHEKYLLAKEAIEAIISEHRRVNESQIHIGETNPFSNTQKFVKVYDKYVGLIIGKQGDTLKSIASQTSTKIFMPQKTNADSQYNSSHDGIRVIEISGEESNCKSAERMIIDLVRGQQERTGAKEPDLYGYDDRPPKTSWNDDSFIRNYGSRQRETEKSKGGQQQHRNDYQQSNPAFQYTQQQKQAS
jgi:far upstream element-binding protein